MMNKKKTSRIGLMKYALLIPVTGILVLSANAKTVVEIAGNEMKGWRRMETPDLQIKQDAPIVFFAFSRSYGINSKNFKRKYDR